MRRCTKVPFFDLRRQFQPLRSEILRGLAEVCDRQTFILGEEGRALEKALERKFGGLAVSTSSGTDAQTLILMALGIGTGDAVLTTPFTFFSTASTVVRLGATPIFVDIRQDTNTLDPAKLRAYLECNCVKTSRGLLTKEGLTLRAVVPVHLFGLCCEMAPILDTCREFDLPVIEDAAQAIGAKYPGPDRVENAGTMGEFGFFSFYPTKNLGAFGDAGMVLCRTEEMAEKIKILRNHGMNPRYRHEQIGANFRMDELQARVLLHKLPYLDDWSRRRWENAQILKSRLRELPGLILPAEPYEQICGSQGHTYHQFVIRTPVRDALREFLDHQGIGTEIYYPWCLHQQPCFRERFARGAEGLPVSEKSAAESLALPIFPELTEEEINSVAATIQEFSKING
jgi:dTDP-4-amino-4,6-dideoxygalactose transaminase